MISLFIKEQKRYSQNELASLFECDLVQMTIYIKKLKEYGVLKAVKKNPGQLELSDLVLEDVEVESTEIGNSDYYYVFTFVGIIIAFERIIKCYPKYISSQNKVTDHLKKIIKVLEKYKTKEQNIDIFNDIQDATSFNLLSLSLYFLQDYYENGIYNSTINTIEINGSGEILWDKTINESVAYLSNNRPYYMELYTKKWLNNDYDYFKRLHEIILTICSKELKELGIIELFDVVPVDLFDEDLEEFGNKEDILYEIQKEMNIQYNTRKQLLLKAFYSYIDHSNHLWDANGFSVFGTNAFNLVWEKVCADVLDNKLQIPIRDLPISIEGIDQSLKLIQLLERPKWYGPNDSFMIEANNTLIPDIISLYKIEDGYRFVIFDAKYYNLIVEPKLLIGQPGISDITKQYLYQLAYKNIIDNSQVVDVHNCFLMPTESDHVINKGKVSMDMFSALNLESIQVRQLPADEMYDNYLLNKKINIDKLVL